ncbi:HAD family hydrolase [Microbacterium tumbae]
MLAIRTVLFDLDGVVRHFDPEYVSVIERRHGIASGVIEAIAFEPALLQRVTTGQMSHATWVQHLGRELGNHDAAAEWARQPYRVDADVLALADELRSRGVRTAILTNGTDAIPEESAQMRLNDYFDAVFNSAEIGWTKPDPRVFQHVLDVLEHAPSEIYFTDDSRGKLAGATALGIPTIHFTGVEALRTALHAVGALD